jgi:hypothetical protein
VRPRIHRGGVGGAVGYAGDEVTSWPGRGAARRLRLPPTPYLFLLPLARSIGPGTEKVERKPDGRHTFIQKFTTVRPTREKIELAYFLL